MNSYFPDVNVWVALAYEVHDHHSSAMAWFERLDGIAYFCRHTQIGFLRLVTHPGVMKNDVKSQRSAWETYDTMLRDKRIWFREEPEAEKLTHAFRSLTFTSLPLSNRWPDAYLAAYAQVSALKLVTFDRALHRMAAEWSVLLS